MRKPDDSCLWPEQYAKVRKEAERLLVEAGALGRFPTPVAEIMEAAKVEEVQEDVLNESFLAKMRRKAGDRLKRALSKVIGLFDAGARLVLIDRTIHIVKQTFVRLHETAHGFMAWQRKMYSVVEDCEKTLDPEIADQFDREANVFASEVLFQLDRFNRDAEEMKFGILTPVNLSKKYGGSIYASVRRYVIGNWRACAVLVLNPPELVDGNGFRVSLRRVVVSPSFNNLYGELNWPDYFTPDDRIGAMVPLRGRRMSNKREIILQDRNGDELLCIAEAFTQKYQVFVLILPVKALTAKSVLMTATI